MSDELKEFVNLSYEEVEDVVSKYLNTQKTENEYEDDISYWHEASSWPSDEEGQDNDQV